MPTHESFVVSSSDKSLRKKNGNSYDYWRGEKKGTIDMEIEVFAVSNHREEAKKIHNVLKASGLENDYFKIRVDKKS